MSVQRNLKFICVSAAAATAMMAASSALAGRCGHFYPVDKPTSLSEVARQCNVSIAALREANPGVDPGNVRPGQHLAVPDEIDTYTSAGRPVQLPSSPSEDTSSPHPYIVSSDYRYRMTDDSGFGYQDASYAADVRRRNDETRVTDWVRDDTLGGAHRSAESRLSFQKLSALRIQTAGAGPLTPTETFSLASRPSAPKTELIRCSTLQKSDGGKVHKIRNLMAAEDAAFVEIDTSTGNDDPGCTFYSASELAAGNGSALQSAVSGGTLKVVNYDELTNPLSTLSPDPGNAITVMVSGTVLGFDGDCAIVEAENGDHWWITPPTSGEELTGKKVTVWGAAVIGGQCSASPSIAATHVIYAEPWRN